MLCIQKIDSEYKIDLEECVGELNERLAVCSGNWERAALWIMYVGTDM